MEKKAKTPLKPEKTPLHSGQGIEQGIEQGKRLKSLDVCIELIQTMPFEDAQISKMLDLKISTVERIRAIISEHPKNFQELVFNLFTKGD